MGGRWGSAFHSGAGWHQYASALSVSVICLTLNATWSLLRIALEATEIVEAGIETGEVVVVGEVYRGEGRVRLEDFKGLKIISLDPSSAGGETEALAM